MSNINISIEQSSDYIINGEIISESAISDSNYNDLINKPSINGVELIGNLTTENLGIDVDTSNLATKDELSSKADKSNTYTKSEIDLMIGDIETAIRSL